MKNTKLSHLLILCLILLSIFSFTACSDISDSGQSSSGSSSESSSGSSSDSSSEADKNQCSVTFCLDDGITVLQTIKVEKGQNAEYSLQAPSKEEDAGYTYAFDKWVSELGGET